MDFEAHSVKQDQIIFSDNDLTIAATGTQFGKSIAGTLWMKRMMHLFHEQTDNFLVCAPSYKILQQSIMPYFLTHMAGFGEYSKTDAVFKMHNGGTCYFRTETDPDSIVGIPNIRAGWLDEAGKLRLYFWENYRARAAAKGAKSLLTTSPYSLNWLYKIIKDIKAGRLPKVKLIQAASWESKYHGLHDPQRRLEMRASMDTRRFDMLYGGEWGQMAGLVYDCWDEDINQCEPIKLDPNWRYVAGVDWGYNPDPFVVVVRAISPSGHHYQVSEYCKTGQTPSDMVDICKSKKAIFGITQFYCDPSQPGLIEEFNRRGIPAIAADNDINRGIGLHYEIMKSRQYKVFKGTSPYTIDELETYHYPEPQDLKPDQDAKEPKPVDQNNHCLDANRYTTIMTYNSSKKLRPYAPSEIIDKTQENQMRRIKRLMRAKKVSGTHSENWD